MNEKDAVKVLKEIKGVLDKHMIIFWLNYGTFLGAYRDGKFIPWDTDIDLCVLDTDLYDLKMACAELEEKGFEIRCKKRDDKNHSVTIIKYDCPTCLFLPYVDEDGYSFEYLMPAGIVGRLLDYMLWLVKLRNPKVTKDYGSVIPFKLTRKLVNACGLIPEILREEIADIIQVVYRKIDSYHMKEQVPRRFFDKLQSINFYGMEFRIPALADEYVEYLYGKNWKTPTRDCIYGEDTKTIVKKCKYRDY